MGSLNDWSKMNLPPIGADGRPVGEPTAPVSQFPADRSPVDDALDRLASIGWLSPQEAQDLATVRQRLAEQDTEIQRLREERDAFRIEGDHGHDDYEDAEDIIRQIAEKRPNQSFDPWASGLCQEFLDRPRRSRATIATIRDRAEAAEAEAQRLTPDGGGAK